MTVTIIRIDGTEEQFEATRAEVFEAIEQKIGARTLEIINLRDGRVMVVDEDGYEVKAVHRKPPPGYAFAIERVPVKALKPPNPRATFFYHAICVEGTTHQIVGDVAILNDRDFVDDDEADRCKA